MATIALPAKFGLGSVDSFRLSRQSNVGRSRYTGKRQIIVYPYALWQLKISLIDYPEPEASAIRGFLVGLEGQKNNFQFPVPGYTKPFGGYAGNGVLNGAAAAQATSISVSGLPANSLVLRSGEFFTIQNELKTLSADANTTAGGVATFNFQPPLRVAAANGIAVTLQNPYALLCAADDDIADWSIKPPVMQGAKLEFIEDY
jgi:hypothetical protein